MDEVNESVLGCVVSSGTSACEVIIDVYTRIFRARRPCDIKIGKKVDRLYLYQ